MEENITINGEIGTVTDTGSFYIPAHSELEKRVQSIENINQCETLIKKEGLRQLPEFAHDTDVGLDMYPRAVVLESYLGNEYKIELCDDAEVNLKKIIEAENIESQQLTFFKRLINFLKGKEYRIGWKRLKFDTGIAIEPDTFYFYFGAPNSRVVKTDVFLQNSMGVIDPTYRGTIRFFYRNLENGFIRDTVIGLSTCCGQIFPAIRVKPVIKFVDKLSDTERGTGGFGSSSK